MVNHFWQSFGVILINVSVTEQLFDAKTIKKTIIFQYPKKLRSSR